MSTETLRTIWPGRPRWPPQLSHSSWPLKARSNIPGFLTKADCTCKPQGHDPESFIIQPTELSKGCRLPKLQELFHTHALRHTDLQAPARHFDSVTDTPLHPHRHPNMLEQTSHSYTALQTLPHTMVQLQTLLYTHTNTHTYCSKYLAHIHRFTGPYMHCDSVTDTPLHPHRHPTIL